MVQMSIFLPLTGPAELYFPSDNKCSHMHRSHKLRSFVLKSEISVMLVIYLADRGPLALLWVLSLWVLCLLCPPGHLQRGYT